MPVRETVDERQANFDFKLQQIDDKLEELYEDLLYEDFPYHQEQIKHRIEALQKFRVKFVKEYHSSIRE